MPQPGSELFMRLDGTFDVAAARRVADVLVRADATSEIYIDFTRVRDLHDTAIGVLAQSLTGRNNVSIRGLGHHPARMMRYLGVNRTVLEPVCAATDAAALELAAP